MDTLPFPQKVVSALDYFGDQTPHIGSLDADAGHDLQFKQVDFRLARAGSRPDLPAGERVRVVGGGVPRHDRDHS